ncbi:Neutral/alkaline non-lysosomal ceramidase [Polystyrenella longa]|uniref:Neutral/alkaline non-lysosomal ceramidase n=1 Tax=Polystyrenella longa TaxID=2528007 RepID=A0A518CN51_9PLAN|nr:hypothetical protein [Polystyrenella longa]QDU80656.1 Neutral/alkaline non-lysosomal ceramidase [Polystyrenella longa]
MFSLRKSFPLLILILAFLTSNASHVLLAAAPQLWAGAAKVDITERDAGPVNDPLYTRALVITDKQTTLVICSLDVVAIGEIGYIKDDFLPTVRSRIKADLNIPETNIMVNASHCHGTPVADTDERTIQAIKEAAANLVPVQVGAGIGHENRVQENRRLKMKDGTEIDVRHAYALPPDEDVAEVGPIDPEIGILRLDDESGKPVAVMYNFACHPIQGAASGGNTADFTGFSSKVIEDNLGEGSVALFVQGCGGDINPVFYKDVDHPRDGEPLGNMLGLSTLEGVRKIETTNDGRLKVVNEKLKLPRADLAEKIAHLEREQLRLVNSLNGTSLSLKTYMPLVVKYSLNNDFPSYYSHRYLYEEKLGRNHMTEMDRINRGNMERYTENIITMEKMTRLNANLRLLKKHQAQNIAAGSRTVEVELVGFRVGNFLMTTFPGELTVRIGLHIKKEAPSDLSFVAGYTNGYIYYAPTDEQLLNVGGAQEDSDCILAPGWQKIYENKAVEILKGL